MLIERIDIESFGKLKAMSIPINNRINIFYGPNESGKSMIAAFIKFMFYGYQGNKDSKLSENEKKLYTPWDTNKVAGSIIVHFKDRKYQIEREYSERERTRIIDLSTNIAVQTDEEPGMFFFKMSEDVFTKTAFLKQFETSEIGGENLAGMIQNIMFTADEDMNTQKTLQRLKDAKNILLSEDKNTGMILTLSKKCDGLITSLGDSVKDQKELLQMEGTIKDLEEKMLTNNAKKNELQDELENYKSYNASQELQKIENARKQTMNLKEALDRVIERHSNGDFTPDIEFSRQLLHIASKVSEKKEKLRSAVEQRNMSLVKYNECAERNKNFKIIEAAGGVDEIGEEYTKLKNSSGLFSALKIIFAVSTAVGILGAIGLYFSIANHNLAVTAIPAVFAVLTGVFANLEGKKKSETDEFYKSFDFENESDFAYVLDDYPDTDAQLTILQDDLDACENTVLETEKVFDETYAQARELLLKWNRTPESDDKSAEDFIKYASAAAEAAEEIQKAQSIYEQYKAKLDLMLEGIDEKSLRRSAAVARKPNYDEKDISKQLDFIIKANEHMHAKENEIGKNIAMVSAKLSDPVIMQSQIEFLEDKINDLTLKQNALELAIDTLTQSCSELRNSFAPRLSESAGNTFKMIMGGKYEDLFVDKNLEMNIDDNANTIKRRIEYLSGGTRDAAYLCLRMALIDLLFENEMPPFICDESFSNLDSLRLENLMKIFNALSKKTQIYIFTCHEREMQMFKNNTEVKIWSVTP
ncbi:MAG: AAA family ATPase [Oscillospiraceae bacterium]|nr:AAA family ATPase [Oscillospiraceae bacterium]